MAQRLHLVDPASLLGRQQHLEEEWIMKDLALAISTTESAIAFSAKRHLLANTKLCQDCNVQCFINKRGVHELNAG